MSSITCARASTLSSFWGSIHSSMHCPTGKISSDRVRPVPCVTTTVGACLSPEAWDFLRCTKFPRVEGRSLSVTQLGWMVLESLQMVSWSADGWAKKTMQDFCGGPHVHTSLALCWGSLVALSFWQISCLRVAGVRHHLDMSSFQKSATVCLHWLSRQ